MQRGALPKDMSNLFARVGSFLEAAHAARAVALIGPKGGSSSTDVHLTHTGVLGFDVAYEIPVVSTTLED